jgi:alpha-L-fucosidase 2
MAPIVAGLEPIIRRHQGGEGNVRHVSSMIGRTALAALTTMAALQATPDATAGTSPTTVRAAPPACPPFIVGSPDGNFIVPGVQGRIVYRRVGGTELALDAYVQRGAGRRPAVVVVHGGGWTAGSRIAYVGQILEVLTRAGLNWVSVDYRLGDLARHADAVDDVRTAVAFVRCHADTLRIDPARIALLGEDAGAHLAALAAASQPPGVRAAVLVGGFYDLAAAEALRTRATTHQLAQASVPARSVPDVLAVHGTADTEVPIAQAERWCAAVRTSGSRCDVLPVEGAIHRAENWRPAQWGYKARLAEWLSKRLGLDAPGHRPYESALRKDIVYEPARGLRLDAHVPAGDGPFPAVVVVHGGGWEAGDKVTYVTPVLEPLARAGLAWLSIDYRLTPDVRHPEQLGDLRAAIRYVRDNAPRLRIDPRRIALLGESASGQMVAQIATEDRSLAAVVSFYGVYDFLPMVTDAAPRSLLVRLFGLTTLDDPARETLRRYSPAHHVSKEMPPMLLIHGTDERLWAQGLAMRDRLAAAGVEHELYAVEGAPHGMENWEGRPEWSGYKKRMTEWLSARLSPRGR